MNKERRNKISIIIRDMEHLKNNLQTVLTEEENAYEQIPENLQNSMRATDSEDAIESMTNAVSLFDEAISIFNEAIGELQSI